MSDLRADAHAVILAVLPGSSLDGDTATFLERGGRAVLLGETRQEYVARAMSFERMRDETREWLRDLTGTIHAAAGGRAIVAVDHELPGIQRLHRLVPPLPSHAELAGMSEAEIEAAVARMAQAAGALGVTLLLSPVLDVYREPGPKLAGRVVLGAPDEVARVGRAYVRGAQSAGVGATAKHFPGEGRALSDPHLEEVRVGPDAQLLEADLAPFRAACEAGVAAVMLGATIIESIDPSCAASVSRAVVTLLREQLGFTGVVVSDDLEMKSIEAGRGIIPTVETVLQAGVDLLLLPGGAHALELAEAIVEAVEAGRVDRDRVAEGAVRVRHLAAGPSGLGL
jgi:beta-N-acetylhexosaminidase